jgi:hypothetical protein
LPYGTFCCPCLGVFGCWEVGAAESVLGIFTGTSTKQAWVDGAATPLAGTAEAVHEIRTGSSPSKKAWVAAAIVNVRFTVGARPARNAGTGVAIRTSIRASASILARVGITW